MKLNWFTRKGIIYLPVSIIGWVILTLAVTYTAIGSVIIGKHSDSVGDMFINSIFNLLLNGLAYTVIAYFTERKS
ncbi:hypothetical protein LX99_03737 [Mucilaginibacter oryzae]|uniref:Uncharacterized protein n=1 Tax=Mucilaginibacter oryzae TaxID=468058 RepID=A0A316H6K0_9SPHI|nr:hypothetical protein [Mucilaginibacter oryzae]PWK76003.1 hypothetical protein LX99_03737 [Mucilaginibacter oryzae]